MSTFLLVTMEFCTGLKSLSIFDRGRSKDSSCKYCILVGFVVSKQIVDRHRTSDDHKAHREPMAQLSKKAGGSSTAFSFAVNVNSFTV